MGRRPGPEARRSTWLHKAPRSPGLKQGLLTSQPRARQETDVTFICREFVKLRAGCSEDKRDDAVPRTSHSVATALLDLKGPGEGQSPGPRGGASCVEGTTGPVL